jgi:Ras-related protein Rab-32
MGTSLIRISVIASRSGTSESDNKNNPEDTEKTNECHLLETPPASIKHNTQFSLTSSILQKAAKIGKFAKVSDRRSQDDHSSVFSSVSNMTPSTPEKRECLYKILVIGELGTGKTSFIKRYVHQFFSQNYRATIGVDFALKVLNWDQSTIIRLQLWDIAGQERFGNMTRVYYKEAVGAFIVFDVTRPATFDAVNKWKTDLDSKVQLPDGSPIPCILLANKCDQPKQGLVALPAKMDEYCKENGFTGWFETSAKENTNIDESAKALVSKILINDKLIHNDMVDGERLILNAEDVEKPKKFCSC